MLRRFWQSGRQFWSGADKRTAWFLTGALLATIVVQVVIQYQLTVWNRAIFDGLEKRDAAVVGFQAMIFPLLAVASVSSWVMLVYLRMTAQRRWRRWLSGHVIDRWLANGRYYQLNLVKGDHGTPEYRIAEDLRVATESPVEFVVGIVSAALSAATFIVVLWTIGGSLDLQLGGTTITIPAFLVIGAIVYAIIASGSMLLIGSRFVRVAENKNQAEAEYRYALTRVRENGESIALIGGEPEERAGLDASLRNVLRRWRAVCFQTMRTTIVYQGSGIIAPVFPIILCAPKFLDGSMSLGQIMQVASAFVIVQQAFSWLVENYPRFADWTASARRVASLLVSLDNLDQAEEAGVGIIERGETKGAALRLENLSVTLDDGTVVVNEAEVEIAPGEKVLVVGESGTGKSSLVRAIAGLWPWGEGKLLLKSGARLFMLPQRPYIPIGTLRRAISYPSAVEDVPKDEVAKAMKDVGLDHLVDAPRRGEALGPDPVRRREAAGGLCPGIGAEARHHRDGRRHLGARSQEPGAPDEPGAGAVAQDDDHQRRPPAGAGEIPSAQAGAGSPPGGRQARARYRSAGAAEAAMALAAARSQGSGQGQSSGLARWRRHARQEPIGVSFVSCGGCPAARTGFAGDCGRRTWPWS